MEVQVPNDRENYYAPYVFGVLLMSFIAFTMVTCASLFILPLVSTSACQQMLYGALGPIVVGACAAVCIISLLSAARQFDWFWIVLFSICFGTVGAIMIIRFVSPVFMNICEAPQQASETVRSGHSHFYHY